MATLVEESTTASISYAFSSMREGLVSLRLEPVKNRKERLLKLRAWIHSNRTKIHEAMYADFRKPSTEVDAIELFHVLNEIKLAVDNLDRWTAPKKIDAPITMLGTRSVIQYEPRGLCLVISPWNYPFSLAVGPLLSALAAGNAVILKPSEMTPNVSTLLKRMAEEIFDKKVVQVLEGGPETSKFLLTLPFDHIFFTGSPTIGKVVMKAASENLTSVTLELGGKSPSIITESANIKDAAERTAVAKFVNNGQTCLAPDYILVDKKISGVFLKEFIHQIDKLFSEGNFEQSSSYCRVVNQKHFLRLNDLIQDALSKGAKIEWGGKTDASTNFIHPMILSAVPLDARMMTEEIFGPIIPIVEYTSLHEAIDLINSKPKALALYLFTTSSKVKNKVLRETSSGGVCVNDSGIHFLNHNLPFGGVNNSGIGKSHGHYGFLAFSNEKPVLTQKAGFTTVRPFYPPYTSTSKRLLDWFLKLF